MNKNEHRKIKSEFERKKERKMQKRKKERMKERDIKNKKID